MHSTAIQIFDSVEQMAIYFVKDYSNQQWRQEIGLEAKAIGTSWEWMGMDGNGWGVGCINRYISVLGYTNICYSVETDV